MNIALFTAHDSGYDPNSDKGAGATISAKATRWSFGCVKPKTA
jgi:hypothetical protein